MSSVLVQSNPVLPVEPVSSGIFDKLKVDTSFHTSPSGIVSPPLFNQSAVGEISSQSPSQARSVENENDGIRPPGGLRRFDSKRPNLSRHVSFGNLPVCLETNTPYTKPFLCRIVRKTPGIPKDPGSTVFIICVTAGTRKWEVSRTYANFVKMSSLMNSSLDDFNFVLPPVENLIEGTGPSGLAVKVMYAPGATVATYRTLLDKVGSVSNNGSQSSSVSNGVSMELSTTTVVTGFGNGPSSTLSRETMSMLTKFIWLILIRWYDIKQVHSKALNEFFCINDRTIADPDNIVPDLDAIGEDRPDEEQVEHPPPPRVGKRDDAGCQCLIS